MRKLIITSVYCFIFISLFFAPFITYSECDINYEDWNRSEIVAKFESREVTSLDSISSFIHFDTVGMNGVLDCIIQIFTSSDNVIKNGNKIKRTNRCGKLTLSFDSLGFQFRRVMEFDGTIQSEFYKNSFINLEYRRFYNHGILKECGFYTNRKKVGSWKYFSNSGELDSIVNYEQDRIISFCKFYKIAKSFGMVNKRSKLPDRTKFIEIAESNNLTIDIPQNQINKVGWPSLGMIDKSRIEREGNFYSNFSYFKANGESYWSVNKYLYDGEKKYGYAIMLNVTKQTIQKYELRVIN